MTSPQVEATAQAKTYHKPGLVYSANFQRAPYENRYFDKKRADSLKKFGTSGYDNIYTTNPAQNQQTSDKPKPSKVNEHIESDKGCLKVCPEIIPRSEWMSRRPVRKRRQQTRAEPPVLVKSTSTDNCETKEQCLKAVKWMQNYHMEIFELSDIDHSFVIGGDGNVYEGRGWGYCNEHSCGYVSIGYMGHNTWDADKQPTRVMRKAAFRLILCGIQKGFIRNPFRKGIRTLPSGLPDPVMWDKYLITADMEY